MKKKKWYLLYNPDYESITTVGGVITRSSNTETAFGKRDAFVKANSMGAGTEIWRRGKKKNKLIAVTE